MQILVSTIAWSVDLADRWPRPISSQKRRLSCAMRRHSCSIRWHWWLATMNSSSSKTSVTRLMSARASLLQKVMAWWATYLARATLRWTRKAIGLFIPIRCRRRVTRGSRLSTRFQRLHQSIEMRTRASLCERWPRGILTSWFNRLMACSSVLNRKARKIPSKVRSSSPSNAPVYPSSTSLMIRRRAQASTATLIA